MTAPRLATSVFVSALIRKAQSDGGFAAVLAKGDETAGSVLVVLAEDQDVAAKSFRNLQRVTVLPAEAVGVADIVGAAQLVTTEAALDALTARAKQEVRA